ncbi:MAG: exodeoxyribonuclease V subunit gamma [Gemmatimonadetes bacterium]|nr:exodeoxyribonuclease V subunit gamma [Gemmatimonadota bacterium]
MPLHLVTAPGLSPLLAHLTGTLRRDPLPPRELETIVVQSQGMRRWITLQLTDSFGCAGSLLLPFPASFVRELGGRIAGDRTAREEYDLFSREALAWRLDALLRALPPGDETFEPLRRYLAGADERRRFGLAAQVASRFDDYQMFRADVLRNWEQGGDAPGGRHPRWQAALWRQLLAGASDDAPHMATRLERAITTLQQAEPAGLPARVTVFGVSTLPPLFVELLVALGRHVPVTVYSASLDPASPHPIATSFGSQSREFLKALIELGATHTRLPAERQGTGGVLRALQEELAEGSQGDAPLALAEDDESLRVHDAHGELRQLEILRDQLLAALADDPTLRPHDLLLLVPDAAAWAPLVDAVFGVTGDETPRLPYRIADRPLRRTQPAADGLARLLALEGGRLERSEVLGFLSLPLVRQGAGLSAGEVELLETLIERANVRWGYDVQSRAALGLPAYEDASWRAGLDRLLLGVAVGRSDDLVLGLLPEAGDTAGEAETMARFASWVDALASTLTGWREPRTLPEWSASLSQAVQRFLVADSGDEQQLVYTVDAAIRRLESLSEVTGYDEQVPFAVVRDWLEQQLGDDGFGSGFLVGGMTVAALKPMRSLPFRVIAVAGLDDGVFPRRERRAAFDLLEHERRPGDRDLRSDDRQLFLDLLLAAGARLILSYSGRAVSDNSPRAPSVVIDELLDHLDRRSAGSARASLVVRHPLQPFSPSYFAAGRDPRLFTFSHAQALAASATAQRAETEPPFVAPDGVLGLADASPLFELTLRDLADCWMNPSQFFCRRVLRFSLDGDGGGGSDDEIFAPNYMQQGGIRARMLATALAGERDVERERRRLLADGSLPPHALGAAWHGALDESVALVLAEVPDGTAAVAVPFVLAGEGWRLKGRLDGVRGDERYVVRAGGIRAEHWIRAWVEHVAMCAAHECGVEGVPTTTVIIGREGKKASRNVIPRVGDPMRLLDELVRAARSGYEAPLPFFPQAGWAWLLEEVPKPRKKNSRAKKDAADGERDPRAQATRTYHVESTNYGGRGGDHEDAYIALCFRGVDPMAERWDDFERLVTTLFRDWRWAGGEE